VKKIDAPNSIVQSFQELVAPANAGVQGQATKRLPWIPAFAGMTKKR
jgi:hypothetical protein